MQTPLNIKIWRIWDIALGYTFQNWLSEGNWPNDLLMPTFFEAKIIFCQTFLFSEHLQKFRLKRQVTF